jgi:hypothetical protein
MSKYNPHKNKENNLNEQIGGFNPCEIFPGSFMHEITTRLQTLETPPPAGGDRLEYIDRVTKIFYECYDILLKYYADQSFYKQDMPSIYTSDRFIKTSHINYTALIFLSFMVEFHMFILIYKGVNYENGTIYKRTINYNKLHQIDNLLEMCGKSILLTKIFRQIWSELIKI